MIENKNSSESTNSPQIDAQKGTAIRAVIKFLDEHLPNFPTDFRTRTADPSSIRENLISRELNIYLNRLRRINDIFMFEFQWEYESRRSVDFGVITVENQNPYDLNREFFVIEAKRLPTPGTGREKEYVEGNLGGLERFKRGLHGDLLPESAMIGYIQDKNNCSHWCSEINKWINNLVSAKAAEDISWDADDLLVLEKDFTTTQKFKSKNTRIVNSINDSIIIYHYLMKLV